MYYKSRFKHLTEKFLKPAPTDYGDIFDLYVNPSSVKRLGGQVRGVITKKGDLYIASDPDKVLHSDIMKALKEEGLVKIPDSAINSCNFNTILPYCLTVQESYNSKESGVFYLGETFIEAYLLINETDIEKYFEKVRKKNPQFTFVMDSINNNI